ncbi:cbb3-type cytochrome c oxidase subunit I [Salisaeta longa]|uniref:cbb3-type cytochrome c oxidase subunit I n=1 Tax=Salisaeta longa TaxID=503170 RepID=UPI0003B36391|nr:cbb3-type cytochrome c oxidase subunit I [Salisaeta longa]
MIRETLAYAFNLESPGTPEDTEAIGWRRRVDRSTRLPVIAFILSGAFWLIIGSVLALAASFHFQFPDALQTRWLTFGRVRPAHLNTMIYGWISMAGVGIAVWLWARLLKTPLRGVPLLMLSNLMWNVGVLIGTIGILAGYSRSVEWLEMPLVAYGLIIPALLLVSAAMYLTLRERKVEHLFISVWYLGAAVLWAPALLIALVLPIYEGVPHATANWWFAHNILGLWLTPIGLGAAYYLIPKVIGRPVYSYHLSYLGFWTLALFYNWAGVHHLVGGPAPQWVVTVSIVFSVMMIIPVVVVAVNHHLTVVGHFRKVIYSPTLRFIVFGAMSYTVVSLQGSLQALRFWQEVTHFTHYTIAHSHLGVYAFVTMIAFGATYYIMPRVTEWEWESPRLISLHFWTTGLGVGMYFVGLTIGGVIQGYQLLDPNIPFMDIVNDTKPWLVVRSVAGTLMTVGHFAFAYLLYRIVLHKGAPRSGPAYFRPVPDGLFSTSRAAEEKEPTPTS